MQILNSFAVLFLCSKLKNMFLVLSRDQYLFKNRPTDGPPNSFYRSLYPKIIQDIEVCFLTCNICSRNDISVANVSKVHAGMMKHIICICITTMFWALKM